MRWIDGAGAGMRQTGSGGFYIRVLSYATESTHTGRKLNGAVLVFPPKTNAVARVSMRFPGHRRPNPTGAQTMDEKMPGRFGPGLGAT